jgi:hypothetical protein
MKPTTRPDVAYKGSIALRNDKRLSTGTTD